MKKLTLLSSILFAALTCQLHAAEPAKIKGEAICAKCDLQEVSACQMAIKVTDASGKMETILADNNSVAKDFHDAICKKSAKVVAEGTIVEKDGKKTITLTKVDEAK